MPPKLLKLAPAGTALLALAALAGWFWLSQPPAMSLRVPGTDRPPGAPPRATGNPVLQGKTLPGPGQPADLPGLWPGFRGVHLDGAGPRDVTLLRDWSGDRPPVLWRVDLGEGYAGAAVRQGRVYVFDYDQQRRQDALRCLSLADGREIWRFAYPLIVKRNHGMSRTVPAVTDQYVVGLGPKCHVVCLDALTGELKWTIDLVQDHGATVPQWYAGQCPLIEGDRVILAPGGPEALLMAVDLATGKVLWKTPNPDDWKMTHVSIVPFDFGGRRQYVYCANRGVVGVDAADGRRLWSTSDWRISIATVPSPVVVGEGKLFFSGGYNAGSLMLQLEQENDAIVPRTLFRLKPRVFGATQQTPIFHEGRLYGVRPDGAFVCLDLTGKVVWDSGPDLNFGLGPYLLAGGVFLVMDDSGTLRMIEAKSRAGRLLAEKKVLDGRESWGPLCLAGSRLLARDLTHMVCLDLSAN